ncbi:MAG: undecaprenyl-diphosphate phosphatase [Marinicellaceae bacterium]
MQETTFIQWLVLAIVQGITEYLPISSSAHLILISKIMQWPDQGLIMDIAAHGGSLLAVLWYFKEEILKLFKGKNWPLFFQLSLASIPLAIVGYTFANSIEVYLRTPIVIALSSTVFGILLYYSDRIQKRKPNKNKITIKTAFIIGLAQVFALIPGASRSGVTMTAAMSMGFDRTKAARFSFLLAIPALLMTTSYGFLKLVQEPSDYNLLGVITVLIVSFLASLLSIKLFLNLINRISMAAFMWYRILLGLLIIGYLQW